MDKSNEVWSGEDILREAMKNPGVREVMEVFGNWQSANSEVQRYKPAMRPKYIVAASSSSCDPLLLG